MDVLFFVQIAHDFTAFPAAQQATEPSAFSVV
jgi:hypothetical protein